MNAKGVPYDFFSVPPELRDKVYYSDAQIWLEKGGVDKTYKRGTKHDAESPWGTAVGSSLKSNFEQQGVSSVPPRCVPPRCMLDRPQAFGGNEETCSFDHFLALQGSQFCPSPPSMTPDPATSQVHEEAVDLDIGMVTDQFLC
eukprot:COSAG05_NODE_4043_length_1703_cov_2.033666_2_plen_143_part_00